MIILDSSTKLQIVFAGAKATNDCKVFVSYAEETATTKTFGKQIATTNGTTAVDILAAPASSTWRLVKNISIENADTAAVTATIRTNISAALATCVKVTLAVGDTLAYEGGIGWHTLDANAQVKQNLSALSYRLKNVLTLTAGTKYSISSGVTAIEIEMYGGGGAGGTSKGATNNCSVSGGGASGGYLKKFIVAPQATAITYAIGGGGTNNVSDGTGGSGGDTTFACNSVTYTAKGGLGGTSTGSGTSVAFALGGAGQLPTNGDINIVGIHGEAAIRYSGTVAASGSGGSSIFGGGAIGINTAGAGTNNNTIFGGGGSGGLSTTSSVRFGGIGTNGSIIIREYL